MSEAQPLKDPQSTAPQSSAARAQPARLWVGLLRLADHGQPAEGAIRPWDAAYDGARLLVLDGHGCVRRWLDVGRDAMDTPSLDRLRLQVLGEDSTCEPTGRPSESSISVAVCTRERPVQLAACLRRVVEATAGDAEIVVVDNAPRTDATRRVVEAMVAAGDDIRRVEEPAPGLSRARNAALRACSGEYVLFTDDDVLVERTWLSATRKALGRATGVAVVTGLVPPAELEVGAQHDFDSKLAWGSRLAPQVFAMGGDQQHDFVFPYSAGHFGTGANMGVHRTMVLDAGGFNERLGAGTRSRGGEDLEIFVRMLRAGGRLVYDPSSIAWHRHRSDSQDLRAQMFGYGSGFSAYLTALMEAPGRRDVLRAMVTGSRQLAKSKSEEKAGGTPPDLLWRELSGMAWGPFAYALDRIAPRRGALG